MAAGSGTDGGSSDGVESFGAFSFAMTRIPRDARRQRQKLRFNQLAALTARRLEVLGYEQQPSVRGPSEAVKEVNPWHRK
jgi:hypothetical protein